jgi:hypothetical protein
MFPRSGFLMIAFAAFVWAQAPAPAQQTIPEGAVYICPMDPDMRSHNPGNCARCGMALVAGLPVPVEYHLDLDVSPKPIKVNAPSTLTFYVHDPWKKNPVKNYQLVHEKLFHMFVVSRDFETFVHDHPTLQPDNSFQYRYTFARPGLYRILGDFYPDGATPQLIAKTVIVPGGGAAAKTVTLSRDYSPKEAQNLRVELRTEPQQPMVGVKTQMYFRVAPADGLEKYLGAWGHMLAASDDLIDLIHEHPFVADGGPDIQFNITFPRVRTYRVWVQFQRNGVVNTAHFDIPVQPLR